jgi:ankyrin repeat protein
MNARDERGNTFLALAVYLANRDNDYERVKLLLEKFANPNIGDLENYSPLLYVASIDNVELLSLLIEYKAKVRSQDNISRMALDYTKGNMHSVITQLINTELT